MTQSENTTRTRRVQALVGLISKVEGGYRVTSSRDPNVAYFISKPNGRIVCTCSDFEKHFAKDPSWRCKHVEAVILAHKQGKIKESLEVDRLKAEGEMDLPTLQSNSLQSNSLHEPGCARCAVPRAADEMLIFPGRQGVELLCRRCFDLAIRGDDRPSMAPSEQPQYATILYPCIC